MLILILTDMIKYIIMSSFRSFEDMEVWQKARKLIVTVYQVTNQAGFSKDYYLVNQIRKSAVSIISNIAEGVERDGNKELINFLYIAKGSCGELRCQLYIALDQNYLGTDQFDKLYNSAIEISRALNKLIKYLKDSEFKGKKYK